MGDVFALAEPATGLRGRALQQREKIVGEIFPRDAISARACRREEEIFVMKEGELDAGLPGAIQKILDGEIDGRKPLPAPIVDRLHLSRGRIRAHMRIIYKKIGA